MKEVELLTESLQEAYEEAVAHLDVEEAIAVNKGLQAYLRRALTGLQEDLG